MLALLLVACAPPFEESRKDLAGFRLVGMSVAGGEPRALVWSGEGAYHSTAPTVTWTVDGSTYAVHVENASGDYEDGELVVSADALDPVVTGSSRAVEGDAGTLSLDVTGDGYTRWMSSSGTFTETGPHAADWLAEEPGLAAIVGLTLDGKGGVTWNWLDVATDDGPYADLGGRLLPVEAPVAAGTWDATITPADNLAGLVLTDVTEPGDTVEILCGLDPFDAAALADGRCGMDDAAGARVRITVAPWP